MSTDQRSRKNAELVHAAIDGSQEAMTELYGMSYNAVYNTVRFLIKDEDTAQDILQDSFIKAFRSLEQLREADSFTAWVKRIAHNRAVDYLRKTTPVSLSSLTIGDGEEEIELADERPENLPEVSLDRKETARLLGEILDSLPQEQLSCISLYYYDQLSVREIAEVLNIPEATVKSRLKYGRKKIETQVTELEKKGTKLYGLSPVLFLLLLMRSQEAMAAEIPADLSMAVLPEKIRSGVNGSFGTETFDPTYTKELSGDILYVKLPELTIGLPASWKGKFGVELAGTYEVNEDGTTGEFSHSSVRIFLLPDEYQGEEDPPFLFHDRSALFEVNCVLEDLDSYMEGVAHFSHPEHYIPIGSGKLGNYIFIISGEYPPESRDSAYNWDLHDEMAGDMDFIKEHTYVTPMEEDPF